MKNKNTYILQLEAKDIYNSGAEGYTVKEKIEDKKRKRYKATLDYSLESIKLQEIANKVLGKVKGKKIFYNLGNKQYTDSIISIRFRYSVKDEEDKKTLVSTKELREELYQNGFDVNFPNGETIHFVRFKRSSGSSRVGKCLFIREDLYNLIMLWSFMDLEHTEGCNIDLAAIECYIALTTSSIIDTIKIKPNEILLIDDYKSVFKDKVMVTKIIKEKYTDEKTGEEKERDRLHTQPDVVEIKNNIWDGQSLLDSSVFGIASNEDIAWVNGKYYDKGMLLLRNRFFKSACFNTNIQQFFKDNNITTIEQLSGKTLATDVRQIKLITTASSIKYLKFGKWENYIKQLEPTFGIVKYDKPTNFFGGKYVQTHYQLLNTLQLKREECKKLLQPSFDYVKGLKQDIRVFRNHLHIRQEEHLEIGELNSTDDFIMTMLQLNNKFENTDLFYNFRSDVADSYKRNLQKGHILVRGNYSVLFGNALEMLKATIKDKNHPMSFKGNGVLVGDEVHTTNFKYNKELLGSRSPHVTIGNLWICKNVECPILDKYFNLTNQIVCVNSINNNLLERLSSCDFDSDQLLLTDCEHLKLACKKNYNNFLVPTSLVEAEKVSRTNTWQQKSDLDIKTSINKIGEIINLSQELNTFLWHKVNNGIDVKNKEIQDIYKDISQLDVMSCIEIDKAKKEFSIDNEFELEVLREKYKETEIVKEIKTQKILKDGKIEEKVKYEITDDYKKELYREMLQLKQDGQDYKYYIKKYDLEDLKEVKVRPYFFKFMMDKKYLDNYIFETYDTTMDYIEEIIEKEYRKIKIKRRDSKDKGFITFAQMFRQNDIKISKADRKQAKRIIEDIKYLRNETTKIWTNEDLTSEEKYIKANNLKNEYIEVVSKMKITKETIKKIITNLDNEQVQLRKSKGKEKIIGELNPLGRKLLSILYKSHAKSFTELFEESKETIEVIRLVHKNENIDNKEIVKIYDLDYIAV